MIKTRWWKATGLLVFLALPAFGSGMHPPRASM
jgi:hypothetical protein